MVLFLHLCNPYSIQSFPRLRVSLPFDSCKLFWITCKWSVIPDPLKSDPLKSRIESFKPWFLKFLNVTSYLISSKAVCLPCDNEIYCDLVMIFALECEQHEEAQNPLHRKKPLCCISKAHKWNQLAVFTSLIRCVITKVRNTPNSLRSFPIGLEHFCLSIINYSSVLFLLDCWKKLEVC